nr:acyltransferase [Cereibacter sediminicola]
MDGLRALAVLGVFAEHFTYSELVRGWSPGMVGVRVFFVLSGFLITSILLSGRDEQPLSRAAWTFYMKRFLRLGPAFCTAIAVAALLGIADMRQDWWVHGLYLSNIQIALQERWTGAGHFWTLSVEEHFYLLWFPLLMLAPRRSLPWVIAAGLLIAWGWRFAIGTGASPFLDVLLPSQLDGLGLGALVALARHDGRLGWLDRLFADRWVRWGALVAVPVLVAPLAWRPEAVAWVLAPLAPAVAAACVIRHCAGPAGQRPRWLSHPWLVHVGRISYGLYVWHYLVPPLLYVHLPGIELLSEGPLKLVRLALWVAVSFALAEISWRLIEQPIMRRRQRVIGRPAMQGGDPA